MISSGNTFYFFKSTRAKLFFLSGILLVPMQKLFMSKKMIGSLNKHISSPSWLQGLANTKEHLDHVPWEHLQIFQVKELTDVLIAHQVTSGFFCQPSVEVGTESNIGSFSYMSVCVLRALYRILSLNDLIFLKGGTLLSH